MDGHFLLALLCLPAICIQVSDAQIVPVFQKRYRESCNSHNEPCTVNLNCVGGICECQPGYYPDLTNICTESLAPGALCSLTVYDVRQCVDNALCQAIPHHHSACVCMSGFYSNGTTCNHLLKHNEACNPSLTWAQCESPAVCDSNTNNTCQCPPNNYYDNVGRVCASPLSPHSRCNNHVHDPLQCVAHASCSRVGVEFVCLCNNGFFNNGSHCSPEVKAGSACNLKTTDPQQCAIHSHCEHVLHGTTTCTCDDGFFQNGTHCKATLHLGAHCDPSITDSSQCVSNAECSATSSHCTCKDGFFSNHRGSCLPKLPPFAPCEHYRDVASNQQECVDHATCTTLAICICDHGYFPYLLNATCLPASRQLCNVQYEQATHIEECIVHAHCENNTCVCDTGFTFDDATQNCVFALVHTASSASPMTATDVIVG